MRIAILIVLLSQVFGAYAYSADDSQIIVKKVEDLEKNYEALKKHVYSNTPEDAKSARLNASLYTQIEELKDQIKAIRGDIEQLQFENAKSNERFVKFSSDIEFRINEIATSKKKDAEDSSTANIFDNIDANLDNDSILKNSDAKAIEIEKSKSAKDAKDAKDKKAGDNFVDKKKGEISAEQEYQDAYSALKNKEYKKSQTAFEEFIAKNKGHELVSSAYYWLGEIYFTNKQFDKAAVQYLKGYQANIRGSRAADNLLKLGKSLGKLEKRKEACITFSKLKKEFPNAQTNLKRQLAEDLKNYRCDN